MFYFEPEPYIRRVIFLTTGHRGSKLATYPGIHSAVRLVRQNNSLRTVWTELGDSNGQTVFQPYLRGKPLSGADGLEAGNPILMAIDSQRIAPSIAYHSIIATIHYKATPERINDGDNSLPERTH